MNLIKEFVEELFKYITGNNSVIPKNNNILRKNSEKLLKLGDLSLPLDEELWKVFNININDDFLDKLKNIDRVSLDWRLVIEKTLIFENHCLFYFNRLNTFKVVFQLISENSEIYGVHKKREFENQKYINLLIENETNLINNNKLSVTEYRLVLIKNILRNLIQYSKYEYETEKSNSLNILLTTRSNLKNDNKYDKIIVCGCVFDPKENTKKITKMSMNEYINKRSIDMQLMAQHKYGLRVKNEQVFIDLINKLGKSASIVDLVEVKHSNSVGLSTVNRQSSSKGASFILYNSARMETIFRTFEERVKNGQYPPLPNINEVDFSLLKEEEEWQLLYTFVLEFPNLIEKSIGELESGKISLHIICSFLNNFVSLFSVYYRRVRILTENRSHLIPVMHARLTLIKCCKNIFNKTLQILDIEPVVQM